MSNYESLKALHTALVDARAGYKEAESRADDPQVAAIFQEADAAHERAHGEIHDLLAGRGEKPDDGGSFMSTVHETVIAIRSAVTGLDDAALSSFASGEERILARYDDAIQESAGSEDVVSVLQHHRRKLSGLIARMKAAAAQ